MNPIHQNEDGKWYFWNETWAFEEGPFETKLKAENALNEYCREYLNLEDKK